MKKNNNNYSPYATFSLEKINSPKGAPKTDPKSNVRKGKGDLRCGRTK